VVSSIFWVVVFVGILIIFHEFGHLFAAKLSRIPVEVFSIGFGPVILKKKLGETEFRLSAIPLGGFIKMAGEEEKAGPKPAPAQSGPTGGYMDKPLGVRIAVIAAGPVSNLVLGFLILAALFAVIGQSYTAPVVSLSQRSDAYTAGLRSGDTVLTLAGDTITSFDDLDAGLARQAGRTTGLAVRRAGRRLELTIPVPPAYIDTLMPAVVGGTIAGAPAAATSIQPGDTLLAVSGIPVRNWKHFTELVRNQNQGRYELSWLHAGAVITDTLRDSLVTDDETGRKMNLAGIQVSTDWYIAPQVAAVVGSVRKGGPASKLGLRPGDSIVAFAGRPIQEWADFADAAQQQTGETATIVWVRQDETLRGEVAVAKHSGQMLGPRGGGIGIAARVPHRRLGLFRAVGEAAAKVATITSQTYVVLYKAVTVRDFAKKALGGPIMVARIAYEGASWGWDYFLLLFAILSINLFVVNLLPVPVLDGGRILLDGIAGILRRKWTEKELSWAAGIGWAMIGALALFTIFNDILRLIRK